MALHHVLLVFSPGGIHVSVREAGAVLYRVYVLLSVLVFLAVYALSPRTLMVAA